MNNEQTKLKVIDIDDFEKNMSFQNRLMFSLGKCYGFLNLINNPKLERNKLAEMIIQFLKENPVDYIYK
jgi:hypothetical protein